jgi:hypothetical protein
VDSAAGAAEVQKYIKPKTGKKFTYIFSVQNILLQTSKSIFGGNRFGLA